MPNNNDLMNLLLGAQGQANPFLTSLLSGTAEPQGSPILPSQTEAGTDQTQQLLDQAFGYNPSPVPNEPSRTAFILSAIGDALRGVSGAGPTFVPAMEQLRLRREEIMRENAARQEATKRAKAQYQLETIGKQKEAAAAGEAELMKEQRKFMYDTALEELKQTGRLNLETIRGLQAQDIEKLKSETQKVEKTKTDFAGFEDKAKLDMAVARAADDIMRANTTTEYKKTVVYDEFTQQNKETVVPVSVPSLSYEQALLRAIQMYGAEAFYPEVKTSAQGATPPRPKGINLNDLRKYIYGSEPPEQ